jgi:hypothetical protein
MFCVLKPDTIATAAAVVVVCLALATSIV